MDLFYHLRIQALRSIVYPDDADFLRRVFRWYSKTFCTPLHLVEELPYEDILRAYFESRCESMTDEELEKERLSLLETDEQRRERLLIEDREAAENESFAQIINKNKEKTPIPKEEMKELKSISPVPQGPTPELPPDISIRFEEVDESELEGFGNMVPKKSLPQS